MRTLWVVRLVLLVLCLLSDSPAPVAGQGGASRFCLRGAPPPSCSGFIRVEIRGGGAMAERPRHHYVGRFGADGQFTPNDSIAWYEFGDWIGAEVGYALNVGDRWAVGATVALETGNETTRYLIRARTRRWLTSRVYAELVPGLLRQERDLFFRSGDGLETNLGFSAEARVGLSGILFASLRYDVLKAEPVTAPLGTSGLARRDPGGTAHAFAVGGGLEGRTAILTSAATLLIGTVLVLIAGLPAT